MAKRLRICLINPKFEPSYWGFDYALPLYPGNKKSSMITGALPYLAGLVPDHDVRLLDENVEEIRWQELGEFRHCRRDRDERAKGTDAADSRKAARP